MADPEQLLRSMPEESPPPEIVLAAVRVFRYRALSAVAISALLVIAGFAWVTWDAGRYQTRVRMARAAYSGGSETLARTQVVDGIRVTLWDVAYGDGSRFVRLLAVGPATTHFALGDPRIEAGGHVVSNDDVSASGGGTCCKPSAADLVIEFPVPDAPHGSIPVSIDLPVEDARGHVLGTAHYDIR